MERLKTRLDEEIKQSSWGPTGQSNQQTNLRHKKPKVVTPANGQTVQLRFPQRIQAEVLGQVATTILNGLTEEKSISGRI